MNPAASILWTNWQNNNKYNCPLRLQRRPFKSFKFEGVSIYFIWIYLYIYNQKNVSKFFLHQSVWVSEDHKYDHIMEAANISGSHYILIILRHTSPPFYPWSSREYDFICVSFESSPLNNPSTPSSLQRQKVSFRVSNFLWIKFIDLEIFSNQFWKLLYIKNFVKYTGKFILNQMTTNFTS